MAIESFTPPNGTATVSRLPTVALTLVAVLYALHDRARGETSPQRQRILERIRNRVLSFIVTEQGQVERLDLTAEQQGGEVIVGVLFPGEAENRRLHVRIESLDHDAQIVLSLALLARGLATPVRIAVLSGSGL